MPDPIPGSSHTITGHIERRWFQHLQALEDAIAYRRARVTAPCPDCTASGSRCDDHACDLDLIADYQQTAMSAILGVPSRIDASQSAIPRSLPQAMTRPASATTPGPPGLASPEPPMPAPAAHSPGGAVPGGSLKRRGP